MSSIAVLPGSEAPEPSDKPRKGASPQPRICSDDNLATARDNTACVLHDLTDVREVVFDQTDLATQLVDHRQLAGRYHDKLPSTLTLSRAMLIVHHDYRLGPRLSPDCGRRRR